MITPVQEAVIKNTETLLAEGWEPAGVIMTRNGITATVVGTGIIFSHPKSFGVDCAAPPPVL